MQRSSRTRFAAASLAVVATLVLAACGDDDDDTGSTDATVSTEVETTDGPATTSATEETTEETTADTSESTTGDTTDGTTTGTGGGEVGTRDEYVEVTKTEIGFEDEAINECVAEAVVTDDVYAAIEEDGRTVEEFQSDGPVDLGIEEAQVLEIAAVMADCGELIPLVLTEETERGCAEEHVDNGQMAEILALSSFGLDLTSELQSASDDVEACLEELAGATTTS